MSQATAHRRLLGEYKALSTNPPEGITAGPVSEDDLFVWEALIQGPEGTPFEGGIFPAELRFPKDYPLAPPKMTFIGEIFHPNVYTNGVVCISILHPPGDDPNQYEHASERWSPIQSVEKILISVMSMLAEPNDESPANIEAAKMWRENRAEYEQKVRDGVRLAKAKLLENIDTATNSPDGARTAKGKANENLGSVVVGLTPDGSCNIVKNGDSYELNGHQVSKTFVEAVLAIPRSRGCPGSPTKAKRKRCKSPKSIAPTLMSSNPETSIWPIVLWLVNILGSDSGSEPQF
ncbi:hypothetical protein NPX13_g10096 [Xylaria arbuscula]|uniref:Ubiquitin-conjugating enzyme E2 2 n=1 Tax=Xylaria arbuscula TaxID=114810 RepID=A0A9W8N5G8_9PEZI|nr:hypothetical protein NPX13_g10096 [Xylaria arbuscula]